ncbi:NAC domain-containing protein 59-like [Tripterygium wilfordii]|uniref:NAC domain-containing protein 59-like n=1 Tax=Tripterygium wilfordii TaxID=458696 RepID=UPI0018F8230C|nr:NAC domain-containing protein 59-like [Tripterygium wilfordii]
MGATDFGPSDKRLVEFYLRQKILGNDDEVSAIAEIDYICNYEPWDLPMLAAIPSEDAWYFFSSPDRRCRKSGNNNRATRAGSWSETGKKREIKNGENQVIGFKIILVFCEGRGRGKVRTNWTIHEYHLNPSCSNGRDYVLSCLHRRPPKKTVNSAVDEVEPGYDSVSQVENTLANMTLAEIAPQFMVLDSNGQDFTSPIAQQPEMHMSQNPFYVNYQHTNGVTDDYLAQFGTIYQQDNNTEAVKLYLPIQDVQLYSRMHAATDESNLSGTLSSLHIEDISDTEAVKAWADGCLPEMHLMQGLSYENLQQANCVADEYNLPLSQFGTSCQQDNILEVNSYPAIQDVHSYCGSMQFAPSDSSPLESSGSQHVEDISHTEAVNMFSPCCSETTLGSDNEWLWDRLFEPGSAYFSYT